MIQTDKLLVSDTGGGFVPGILHESAVPLVCCSVYGLLPVLNAHIPVSIHTFTCYFSLLWLLLDHWNGTVEHLWGTL